MCHGKNKRRQLRKVHIDGKVWVYRTHFSGADVWDPDKKKYESDLHYPWPDAIKPSDIKKYILSNILHVPDKLMGSSPIRST